MFLLWRVKILYASLLCICTILIIYGKTINFGFNLDDKLATSIHPSVKKGLKGIPEILTSPYLGKYEPRYGGYRPLTRITFAIEYALFGANTSINHIINLLIYIFSCIFFFHLIKYIFPKWKWWLVALTALIFVCHPLHVEVVSSLKNREVLLSFFFGISSVLILIKKTNPQRLIWSVILFFLAAFSKLDAVFFPVFAAFLFYVKERWKVWQSVSYGLLLPVLAVAIYFLVQSQFPEPLILSTQLEENPIVGNEFSLQHFATVAYILAYNLRLIFIPNQLLFFYGTGPFTLMSWANVIVIISALFHIFILGMMVYGLKKKQAYSLIIVFYFFSIGLYMNLVQVIPGVTGDRFLYAAVGAFSLLIGYLIAQLLKYFNHHKIAKITTISFCLFFCGYMSVKAYNRVDCWESPITLGSCDIAQLENSLTAQIIYLRFLDSELKKGNSNYDKKFLINESIEYGYKVLKTKPNEFNAKQHLGYVYCAELDSIRLGGQLLFEAMQMAPGHPQVLYNLGICFEKKGDIQNATKFYQAASDSQPESVTLKSKLMIAHCQAGKMDLAKTIVDDLVENYAHHFKSFISEGTYYIYQQDTLKATQSFEKALAIKSDLKSLKKQVLQYYIEKGDTEKIKYYQ